MDTLYNLIGFLIIWVIIISISSIVIYVLLRILCRYISTFRILYKHLNSGQLLGISSESWNIASDFTSSESIYHDEHAKVILKIKTDGFIVTKVY